MPLTQTEVKGDYLAQSESGGLRDLSVGFGGKKGEESGRGKEEERKEHSRGALQGRAQGHGLRPNKTGFSTKILEIRTDEGDMEIKERKQTLPEAELVFQLRTSEGPQSEELEHVLCGTRGFRCCKD